MSSLQFLKPPDASITDDESVHIQQRQDRKTVLVAACEWTSDPMTQQPFLAKKPWLSNSKVCVCCATSTPLVTRLVRALLSFLLSIYETTSNTASPHPKLGMCQWVNRKSREIKYVDVVNRQHLVGGLEHLDDFSMYSEQSSHLTNSYFSEG